MQLVTACLNDGKPFVIPNSITIPLPEVIPMINEQERTKAEEGVWTVFFVVVLFGYYFLFA
jgi:hypothetical protein